jgi:hypothetical protein
MPNRTVHGEAVSYWRNAAYPKTPRYRSKAELDARARPSRELKASHALNSTETANPDGTDEREPSQPKPDAE